MERNRHVLLTLDLYKRLWAARNGLESRFGIDLSDDEAAEYLIEKALESIEKWLENVPEPVLLAPAREVRA